MPLISKINILIIEDEGPAASRLKQLVYEILPGAVIFGHLDSIASSVKWLEINPPPDLIFCDIQLADGQSFEIFERIIVNSPIIFTTAFDQFAIKAFKLNSIDYLLKPIDPTELQKSIQKFENQQLTGNLDLGQLKSLLQSRNSEFKTRFLVKIGEKIQSIRTEDIAFFYSTEKISFLQNRDVKKYILDYTLDQLENMLDSKKFFRLNRKYIASFESISEIHTYSSSRLKIKLANCEDNDILISREKVGALKEWLDG